MGDVARVATIPGTFNNRRKEYCIPLTTDDLERAIEDVIGKDWFIRLIKLVKR